MYSFKPIKEQKTIDKMSNPMHKGHAVELLRQLKNTTVPKSVDSGEAITYIALKDAIIDNVISIISVPEHSDAEKPLTPLCVDHQKLANVVLERTFDAHTQLLQQRLKEAEREAAMWRKVTLFGGHRMTQNAITDVAALLPAATEQHQCQSTQTYPDDVLSNAYFAADRVISSSPCTTVEQWFSVQAENLMVLLGKKAKLLCEASFSQVSRNMSVFENTEPQLVSYTGSDTGNYSRSLPESAIVAPCSPLEKKRNKKAPGLIASVRSSATKSPMTRHIAASTSFHKEADRANFAEQDCASPNFDMYSLKRGSTSQPLYIVRTLQLKRRNSAASSSTTRTRNYKGSPAFHLPQL
ncbi:hypothetical protein ABL78_7811 [Leptomonas seymouri]|uniref:Uncharacterized protein n=1 Tax=Leptomonas seymouri TaxID=5684 RepID=A0A0N0P325_LEPSE|nr:hypothetical protein ABL78_7811 [Leptomonas seymouri]|eukprot:KPI83167.1 hypothetical protein ABL78_7811 [Leptomonas seymouri]